MKHDNIIKFSAAVFLFVATWLIAYGTVAFISWNWNPGDWAEGARFMCGFCGTTIGCFLFFTVMST